MWREAVVAYCEVLSGLIGGTEEDDDKPLIIVCIRDTIWTENQKNSKHSYEPFSGKSVRMREVYLHPRQTSYCVVTA